MAKITFNNKQNFSERVFEPAEQNQILTAENINEIKNVVNGLDDVINSNRSRISNVETKATSNQNSINSLNTKTRTLETNTGNLTTRVQRLENRNQSNVPSFNFRYDLVSSGSQRIRGFDYRAREQGETNSIYIRTSNLSSSESIDYYILIITLQYGEANTKQFTGDGRGPTCRFIFEPAELVSTNGIEAGYQTNNRVQSNTIMNTTDRDTTAVMISALPISGSSKGFQIKAMHTTFYNGGNIVHVPLWYDYRVIAKIRRVN